MHVQMCILIVIYISGKRKGTNGAWASVFKCLPKVLTHLHRSPESKISPLGSRQNVLGKRPISTVCEATLSDSFLNPFPHILFTNMKLPRTLFRACCLLTHPATVPLRLLPLSSHPPNQETYSILQSYLLDPLL